MIRRVNYSSRIFDFVNLGISFPSGLWPITSGTYPEHSAAEVEQWRDPDSLLSVSFVAAQGSGHLRLRWECLAVDVLDGQLVASAPPGTPQSTIDHFLADQVIPRLMAHDGAFVLHAGANRFDGRAVLQMGPSGRGKSTLAKSLDNAGRALMGDDAMVIAQDSGRFCARPVYPSLRLHPDSIAELVPADAVTTHVAHYSPKQSVALPGPDRETASPVPIAALFLLSEPTGDPQINLRRLSIVEACMALVESSFSLDPSDTESAHRRMTFAASIARAVPAFEMIYPREYTRLPDVQRAIVDQLAELEAA